MMFKLLSENIMISKNEGQKTATYPVAMVYVQVVKTSAHRYNCFLRGKMYQSLSNHGY